MPRSHDEYHQALQPFGSHSSAQPSKSLGSPTQPPSSFLICALPLALRPPERVALTPQILRVYKVDTHTQHSIEAPSSRDMAHAQGPLSLYLQVPLSMRDAFHQLLQMIGYWGQASSLAWCSSIQDHLPPPPTSVSSPCAFSHPDLPLHPFFSSLSPNSETRIFSGMTSSRSWATRHRALCRWISTSGHSFGLPPWQRPTPATAPLLSPRQ